MQLDFAATDSDVPLGSEADLAIFRCRKSVSLVSKLHWEKEMRSLLWILLLLVLLLLTISHPDTLQAIQMLALLVGLLAGFKYLLERTPDGRGPKS